MTVDRATMSGEIPAASCTLSKEGGVTTVPVRAKCKVTYEFKTEATKADLVLPYVVSVNSQVLPEYADKPGVMRGTNKKIELTVDPGSNVELFLNSDVHPKHRKNPVYAIQAGNNDVLVKIKEVTGRNTGHLRSTLSAPLYRSSKTPGKRLEVYDGFLTGDIWMEISHVYTAAEADELMPEDTAPVIRDAVSRIYARLHEPKLVVQFPASDSVPGLALTLRLLEEMQDNVRLNTTLCGLLTDILPRTHPHAFTALLTAAHAAGITELRITSAWRPCIGSIAHRAGLGLDVNYVQNETERVSINLTSFESAQARNNGGVSEDPKIENDKAKGHAVQQHESTLVHNFRNLVGSNKSVKQVFDPWYMDVNTQDSMPPVPNRQITSNERLHNNHLHLTVLEPRILP